MGYLNSILSAFKQSNQQDKKEMFLGKDKETVKRMVVDLNLQTQNLTKKDIQTWRTACQIALNIEDPRRLQLYGVYDDTLIDMHLEGAIAQRCGMTTKKVFKLTDINGKEDEAATELFQSVWFEDFVELVLESIYWGHSLIQMGDVKTNIFGKKYFDGVELVPRRHVSPEFGVIIKNQDDEWSKGFSFREGALADWCIEAGKPKNLGLLMKCAPHAISKKNMTSYWDMFGELFGMPVRIAKTTSRDKNDLDKIQQQLDGMGAAFWGLFPEGTEIEIKQSSRGDAFNVYDKRIDRANSEISKGILNQTMTIDSGSSLSQSETHLEVFLNTCKRDAKFVRNTVNDKLIPLMLRHGFPLNGLTFEIGRAHV